MSSDSIATDFVARLLVVDDDLVQRKIIAKIGTQAGFQTAEASSFEEAERMLQVEQYDCVTLDLSLGPRSGVLLLRTMIETRNSVPVIVVSGATEQVLQTTLDVAGNLRLEAQTMHKPLNLIELRAILADKRAHAAGARGSRQLELSL
jgi:DNA-binding response OmpR family regulator